MSRTIPYMNEIVSLTVMLLMTVALVAGQADATIQEEVRAGAAFAKGDFTVEVNVPFRTTVTAHIDGQPLTISIDAVTGNRL